ncbi:hypothetical protein MHK_003429 [Candidatus Magnetomorum sp. HK-1]|nr:hypothetical protein MHK_003429 [Candidatus Magnetomorum sp. HK-1]
MLIYLLLIIQTFKDFSIGKFLENVVYIELKRTGHQVYTGKISGKEIDFIAEKNNEKKYTGFILIDHCSLTFSKIPHIYVCLIICPKASDQQMWR